MGRLTRGQWERTHQHFERDWWGDCANTYGEESKQLAYARLMDLDPGPWLGGNAWPVYDMSDRRILDVGGGPVSMLLKTVGSVASVVIDPCEYPDWTLRRYEAHDINVQRVPAEDWLPAMHDDVFDEAWCYNVLQHVHDPELIVREMRRVAVTLRIFEWVETEAYLGHPHTLHIAQLQEWCGGEGRSVVLDELYQELPADDVGTIPYRVEQLAWGGAFTK